MEIEAAKRVELPKPRLNPDLKAQERRKQVQEQQQVANEKIAEPPTKESRRVA